MARNPPAFQCYAASLIADRNYKLMSPAERGLFMSMYLDSWVNSRLPADTKELAKYLGFEEECIRLNLTDKVLHFFKKDGEDYICPELEDYRKTLVDRNLAKAMGGKKGAELKKQKRAMDELLNKGQPIGYPQGIPLGPLDKTKTIQNNTNSLLGKNVLSAEHQAWVDDYNDESADDYLRASKG